jgi:hypothetical protein
MIENANPAAAADTDGARRIDLPGGTIAPRDTLAERNTQASRQLEILAARSLDLADRVKTGEIEFIDAVDIAYEAAYWAGLTETVGDDIVQTVLATAFATVPRGRQ